MPQYLITRPDGSLGYSSQKPKSGPVVTKEEADAFVAGRYPLNPEMGLQRLAESEGLSQSVGQRRLAESEAKFASVMGPEISGIEGGLRTFTRPSGVSETLTETGERFSIGMPAHYTQEYSPLDQKRIEKFYKNRSLIMTDPELDMDEDARQNAIDLIDRDISRVPKLPPTMREPTAQEKFDQSLVTLPDGSKAFYDGKTIKPLGESKDQLALQQRRQDLFDNLSKIEADREKVWKEGDDPIKGFNEIMQDVNRILDLESGKTSLPTAQESTINPRLEDTWVRFLKQLDKKYWGKLNQKQIIKEKDEYIRLAEVSGIDAAQAEADFFMRWDGAIRDHGFWSVLLGADVLPKSMNDEAKKQMMASLREVHSPSATPTSQQTQFGVGEGIVESEDRVTFGGMYDPIQQALDKISRKNTTQKDELSKAANAAIKAGEPIQEIIADILARAGK